MNVDVNVYSPGSEVSRSSFLQNGFVQFRIGEPNVLGCLRRCEALGCLQLRFAKLTKGLFRCVPSSCRR